MSTRPTKVPSLPAPTPTNDLEFRKAVKGIFDVREGVVGDPLDAFVKVRDLTDPLFLAGTGVGSGSGGGGLIGPPGPPGPGFTPPDLTPPPAPTGLAAAETFISIILSWDSLPGGYAGNHAYTEVWRSSTSSLGDAVLIGTSLTKFYDDSVGNPGGGYYYWIRYRSKADVTGPYNDTDGLFARTGQDPTSLLTALTGRITASQLFTDLAKPIGNLAREQELSAESDLAAIIALHAEQRVRAEALLEEARERGTAIEFQRRIIDAGDEQLAREINTLTAVVEGVEGEFAAALSNEAIVRASADSAEAAARLTLAAELQDPVTGLSATRATLASDYLTTADTNAAIAASASALTASFSSADAATLASANAFTYSRATIDGAISSSITTLRAEFEDADDLLYAALSTEATVRADETGNLFGKYSVKIDLANHVTGFGLLSTLNNGVPTSAFGIRADSFWVAPPSVSGATAPTTNLYRGKVWLDTSGPSPITKYYDGVSSWTTTPTLIPFTVQASPVTLPDGSIAEPGVYMDVAFIKKASINSALIGDLTASKITAGFTQSVDIESGVFVGSEFYIGGTVTYEYGDPERPTLKTGVAGVANPNIRLTAAGADFNVDYFRVYNGVTYTTPFEIRGGIVRIKNAAINDAAINSAKIYEIIQSDDFNGSYTEEIPSTDPHFSSLVLLLPGEGSSGSVVITDESNYGRTPEFQTNIAVNTGSARGFGMLSATPPALLQYASSTDFNLREVFTLEFFVRRLAGQSGFLMARSPTSYCTIEADGNLYITNMGGGSHTVALTEGTIHHIVMERDDAGVFRVIKDGAVIEFVTGPAESLSAQPFAVYGVPGRPDLTSYNGLLGGVRLTQGVARYGGAFSPLGSTHQFPGGDVAGGFLSFGTAGWAIAKNGTIVANNLYSRGSIAGGGFSPLAWAWPVSGGGFYLGPEGIRLGREASGRFFEIGVNGTLRAPGLSIIDGNANFSGNLSGANITGASGTFSGTLAAGIVETTNIAGAGITTGYAVNSTGASLSITTPIPAGSSLVMVLAYLGQPFIAVDGTEKDAYNYTKIPTGTLRIDGGAPVTTQSGTLVHSIVSPPAGATTFLIERDTSGSEFSITVLVTKR